MDDRRILESYPLPIARGYRRYRNAVEVRERHDAAYFLFEVYLKYLSAVAISHYLAWKERDHRVNAVLKGLARPALGEWLRFLRECLNFLGDHAGRDAASGDPAIGAMAAVFETKASRWGSVVKLYNVLQTFLTGKPSDKRDVSLEMLLGGVVAYRNRVLGHGAPLDGAHYKRFAEAFGDAFPELLHESTFLVTRRLISFHSIRVLGGSKLHCEALEYMGLNPMRRTAPLVLPYGSAAPSEDVLYLLEENGRFLSLHPLLLAHKEDVYFLNEGGGSPEYLSYATGERHRPPNLGGDQGDLFERILGYRVEEGRLSRIGDDLVGVAPAPTTLGALEEAAPTAGVAERRLGDYRIVRELGRGGMGTVFEAVQESLGRRVALKVLPGTFALDPRRVERFYREARATARIHHPNIIPVYEVGESGGSHYYAMEYIDGTSLDRLFQKAREDPAAVSGKRSSSTGDPAYIAHAVEQMACLAEGLDEAHRLGLIHRDVKPSNIMVETIPAHEGSSTRKPGRYVLVDFGLVHETDAQTLTRSGELVGTLSYMPPEQVSRSKVDARADVYSLGATLYEILTLRAPFERKVEHGFHSGVKEKGDFATQRAILFDEPAPPRTLNPRLNRDLDTIILKALEKNPERRYASAAELAADLRRFLRYEPIRARSLGMLTRLRRRVWRHRGKAAATGTILALALVASLLVFYNQRLKYDRLAADYEPRVLEAAASLQLGGLTMKMGGGYLARTERFVLELRGSTGPFSREVGRAPVEKSLRELDACAAILPGRPEAHYQRARALLLLLKEEDALEALGKSLAANPRFVPALGLRSSLREKRGDRDGASSDRELALKTGGSWGSSWLEAGQAMAQGRWPDAVKAYDALIRFEGAGEPEYLGSRGEARIGRGMALLEMEDFQDAVASFSEARGLFSESVEPTVLLAKTYYLMGRRKKAKETFEEAFQSASAKEEVVLQAAGICRSVGDSDTALEWVKRLPEGNLMRERNRCLLASSPAEMVEAGRKAVDTDPRDAMAHVFLAQALFLEGEKLEEVQEHSAKAVELAPENSYVQYYLGLFNEGSTDPDLALAYYQEAIRLDPEFGWPYGRLGMCLGICRGETQKALEYLETAFELDPQRANTYWIRSRLELNSSKLVEAIQSVRKAVELNPFHYILTTQHWVSDLLSLLRKKIEPEALGHECAGLVNTLERRVNQGVDEEWNLDLLIAQILVLNPVSPEPRRALEYARRAVDLTGGKKPEPLAGLAEVQFLSGEWKEAVLTLEKALRLSGDFRLWDPLLLEYRRALLPCAPSYASIDAALAGSSKNEDSRFLEAQQAPSCRKEPEKFIAYLKARIFQRAGKMGEAMEVFRPLVASEKERPEPGIRLAECLRVVGGEGGSGADFPSVLKRCDPADRELWEQWVAIQFLELDRRPREVLADLTGAGLKVGYPTDLRWLLERLDRGEPIRIRCGGEDYEGPAGENWGKDRFFLSGSQKTISAALSRVIGAQDRAIYQVERWFDHTHFPASGYRIPLPRGQYRVTLSFVESWIRGPGLRRFGVRLEGKEVLPDYDIFREVGFGRLDQHAFESEVEDGFLDILFVPIVLAPMVTTIQVERLQAKDDRSPAGK